MFLSVAHTSVSRFRTKSVTVVDTISTTVIFYLFPFWGCFWKETGDISNISSQKQIYCPDLMRPWSEKTEHGKPFSPRDDLLHLSKKIFFLCPHLCQLVTERGQTYLFIHKRILPYWSTLYSFIFLCGVALTVEMFCPTVL